METFGSRLRNLRSAQRIGLKTLGPQLGVTYGYLSKLENEQISPSEDLVLRVARYFGQDPDVMLLAAGRIPADIVRSLQEDPEAAVPYLRERFRRRDA